MLATGVARARGVQLIRLTTTLTQSHDRGRSGVRINVIIRRVGQDITTCSRPPFNCSVLQEVRQDTVGQLVLGLRVVGAVLICRIMVLLKYQNSCVRISEYQQCTTCLYGVLGRESVVLTISVGPVGVRIVGALCGVLRQIHALVHVGQY